MATKKKVKKPKYTPQQKHKLEVRARRRKRAALANDPAQLTQPLTPKLLGKELKSATDLRYGGQQRQLGAERRISDTQQTNIGNWFGEYQKDLDAAFKRTQGIYAGANTQLANITNQSTAVDATQRAALSAQEQASAQQRGATVDPALAQQAQQAAASRRSQQDAFRGLVGAQGAAQSAYVGDQRRIGGLEKLRAREGEAKNRRTIEQSGRELASDIGNFKVQYSSEARERERKNMLERAAFGLDQAKAAADVDDDKRKARLAKAKLKSDRKKAAAQRRVQIRGQNVTRRGQDVSQQTQIRGQDISSRDRAAARNKADKKAKGPSRFSPTQRRNNRTTLRKALGLLRSNKNTRGRNKAGQGAYLRRGLADEKGYDPLMAKAASEIFIYGKVFASTAKAMKREYGIGLKVYKKPKPLKRAGGKLKL